MVASERATNDNGGNLEAIVTNQHLLGDDGQRATDDAWSVRSAFLRMSTLFAINHGCTVSCLSLANARLGSIGIWQSSILYASYTAAALFGASYFVKALGSRRGLVLGMGMSASYVVTFYVASFTWKWLQDLVTIGGALVGGVGSSILWVSQGTYFSCASQLFASKEGMAMEDVTANFGGLFAFILLIFEVILRLLSTLLIETAGLSWKVIFGIYSFLSIGPVLLTMGVKDVELLQYNTIHSEDRVALEACHSPPHKAAATVDLLRKDPKAKYLAPVSILFGLSMAFGLSVLNGEIIEEVLDDPNSTFAGLYTAFSSTVAATASFLFGLLEASHSSLHAGKGLVLTIGSMSYLAIALIFLIDPSGSDLNRYTMLLLYALMGIGRSTYEGTLRAAFADFFPTNKEGAFGNMILFSGLASTIGYVLTVTGALQCKNVSAYCIEYSDGSIHNVLVLEVVIIVAGAIAIPSFWRAIWMFRQEQKSSSIGAQPVLQSIA